MKIADIARATFRFHRAVYVTLTEKCPIRCRHCFVESAPTREEQADVEHFTRWIAGVAAATGLEVVFFSGGAPRSMLPIKHMSCSTPTSVRIQPSSRLQTREFVQRVLCWRNPTIIH